MCQTLKLFNIPLNIFSLFSNNFSHNIYILFYKIILIKLLYILENIIGDHILSCMRPAIEFNRIVLICAQTYIYPTLENPEIWAKRSSKTSEYLDTRNWPNISICISLTFLDFGVVGGRRG